RSLPEGGTMAERLTPTRRSFLLLPALGLLPYRTESGQALPQPSPVTRILFGGDVMLSRNVGMLAREKADPAWPLHDMAGLFASADLAFVNLEAPFSDHGHRVEKGMVFKAEPEMVDALRLAGIDIVSTANNHVRDCGAYGVGFTLDLLARNGIAAVGTGHTEEAAHQGTVLERNGVRFGFLAYTYDQSNGNHADRDNRVAMMDAEDMSEDVEDMRERSDVVIVSMHAGLEYWSKPTPSQRKFARAAIDAGASVVVGHHPHVTQPVESWGNGVIFYSLGNLVFDQFQRKETQRGLIADVRFVGRRLAGYGAIPVDIVRAAPRIAPRAN
ncbi:MAG TPA: CapA family protein, partial [Bryobacteraceae bacterium]|nr:CapA family protein [Bryobacteraceae bacterium]